MKKETIVTGVKIVVGLGITVGVNVLVKNAVKIIAPQNMKLATKVCVWVTGMLIAGVVDKVVSNYTNDTINFIDNAIDVVVEDSKKVMAEQKV